MTCAALINGPDIPCTPVIGGFVLSAIVFGVLIHMSAPHWVAALIALLVFVYGVLYAKRNLSCE